MDRQDAPSHTNRLITEKSPYLLQHAHNPVEWFPWGDEAFEKARTDDKPVFLSIGYSTCHWCHVMERESFEDPDIGHLMNSAFVSIKVDREERPDIDSVYMTACQILTGGGGWPLTIIMTPDGKPFFAGTYIPRESAHGRIGMRELIFRVRDLWTTDRDKIANAGNRLVDALRRETQHESAGDPDPAVQTLAYEEFVQRFDERHGGFGGAPKFPTPSNLLFLLRCWRRTGNAGALEMVEKTLEAIRSKGIYDHVGFGVHRYSTDAHWLVPHFEKMLYDQALFATTCIEAYQATGKPLYRRTAEEIFEYVLCDMTAPEGGFYSGEDADSEGVEGRFYVWTLGEIQRALDSDAARLAINVFGVEADGNFVDEATRQRSGANILHLARPVYETAAGANLSVDELFGRIEKIRRELFAVRERRVRPSRDDKILTDWNGLMIAALAKGAAAFNEPRYAEAAAKAADFLLTTLRQPDGRLLHRYRDGEAGISAFLADHAFFVWGLIELYEATFRERFLESALYLANDMLQHFLDHEHGGLFLTPDDGEEVLVRRKEVYDGAIPSGNAVAMLDLLRLGRMTGNPGFEAHARGIGRAFSSEVQRLPSAYPQFLAAMDFAWGPSSEVVIAGRPDADDTRALLDALRTAFLPSTVVLLRPTGMESTISRLAPFTAGMTDKGGHAVAYVCHDYRCELPTKDAGQMLELIWKRP